MSSIPTEYKQVFEQVKNGNVFGDLVYADTGLEPIAKIFDAVNPKKKQEVCAIVKHGLVAAMTGMISDMPTIMKFASELHPTVRTQFIHGVRDQILDFAPSPADLHGSIVRSYRTLFPDGDADKLKELLEKRAEADKRVLELARQLEEAKRKVAELESQKPQPAVELSADRIRELLEKERVLEKAKADAAVRKARAAEKRAKSGPDGEEKVAKKAKAASKADSDDDTRPIKPTKPFAAPKPRVVSVSKPKAAVKDDLEIGTQPLDWEEIIDKAAKKADGA